MAGFVVRLECAGYRAFVTPLDQPSTHRPARATADVVIALMLAVLGWIVVVVLPVLVWYWPVWRLLYGNDQYGFLGSWPITPVLLLLAAGLTLFGWPALIRAVTTAHRLRLVHLLGVSVPPPPRPEGPLRTVAWRELLSPATWRQFGYHLAAPLPAAAATVAVLAAWLVAYPRAAGFAVALAELDAAAARTLLGPSQHEQLARQVAELTRSRSAVIAATDAERRRIERAGPRLDPEPKLCQNEPDCRPARLLLRSEHPLRGSLSLALYSPRSIAPRINASPPPRPRWQRSGRGRHWHAPDVIVTMAQV